LTLGRISLSLANCLSSVMFILSNPIDHLSMGDIASIVAAGTALVTLVLVTIQIIVARRHTELMHRELQILKGQGDLLRSEASRRPRLKLCNEFHDQTWTDATSCILSAMSKREQTRCVGH
jgi:hypothetical protein